MTQTNTPDDDEECQAPLVAAAQPGDLLSALDAWQAVGPGEDDDDEPFEDVRSRGLARAVDLS